MRLVPVLAFLLFSTVATQAFAIDAASWQKQLQGEVTAIQKSSPYLKAKGEVMVEDVDGGQVRALLPSFVLTASDKSTWEIPAIALQAPVSATGTAPVKINLPQKFTHQSATNQPLGALTIASQNVQGSWSFQQNAFETLAGSLNNVTFSDTASNSSSVASKIDIKADKAGTVGLTIGQIRGSSQQDGGKMQAQNGTASYNFSGGKLSLTRLIGLLNPAILLAENQKLGLDTSVNALQLTTPDGKVTTFDKAVAHLQVQPVTKGETVSIRSEVNLTNVQHTPANAFSAFLPQTATIIGTATNAPLELLAMAPGQDFKIAQAAMVKAGTRINIDQIDAQAPSGLTMKGTGQLTAAANVPTGFVGTLNLDITNLAAAATAAQRQMLAPGGDRMAQTQTAMALMALQGMSRQNGMTNQFVIELTPQGQVLVNGQDLSGLLGKTGLAMPAVPVELIPHSPF